MSEIFTLWGFVLGTFGAGFLLLLSLRRLQAAAKRSTVGLFAVRAVMGVLATIGLALWVGLWFERNVWLGVAQAITCGLVLAHEIGILPSRRRLS